MRPALTGAVLCLLIAGCGGDRTFLADADVTIVAPSDLDAVDVPFDLRWEAGGHDTFLVFVDRAPIAPGSSLRSIARAEDDRACLARAECPDPAWLRARGVYLVEGTSLRLDSLPERDHVGAGRELHQVAVVPFAHGVRAGEGGDVHEVAFVRSFDG